MKRLLVQAAVAVAVLSLGSCGSDAIDSTTPDKIEASPEGAANEVVPAETANSESIVRLWIKPDLVDCVGEMEQQCMQIAESEDGDYLYFYDQIAGFNFVEGTSYVIDVRIEDVDDPPADGSSLAYTLVGVVETS